MFTLWCASYRSRRPLRICTHSFSGGWSTVIFWKRRSRAESRSRYLRSLFDDDLVFVHLNGYITSKEEWMSMLRSGSFVYDRIDLKEASVRAYGDTAVLVGKATFVVNGGSVNPLVYTELYARFFSSLVEKRTF